MKTLQPACLVLWFFGCLVVWCVGRSSLVVCLAPVAPEPLGGRAAERLCDTNFSFELQRIKRINTQENHTLS